MTVLIVLFLTSTIVRIALVLYGVWQDVHFKLKYTDVDYNVFTDAATYAYHGQSPYLRETYRYTPLLSWLLIPNNWILCFGKLLFILFDLLTAYVIGKIVKIKSRNETTCLISMSLWLFHPLVMAVSSRGNAEAIMAFLVNATIYSLLTKQYKLSGFLFALSVHFKIYPVIYTVPIFLYLNETSISFKMFLFNVLNLRLKICCNYLFGRNRLQFFVTAFLTFVTLVLIMYHLYGYDFLNHTYLYHYSRKDIRHNFSVYFYMFYLQKMWWFNFVTFLNQAVVLLFISFYYFNDPPFCFLLLTHSFVTFNKICTSQYFLWYLSLLPGVYPGLTHITLKNASVPLVVWSVSQGLWLGCAYMLEFMAINTFILVWTFGLCFFSANVWIVGWLVKTYKVKPKIH